MSDKKKAQGSVDHGHYLYLYESVSKKFIGQVTSNPSKRIRYQGWVLGQFWYVDNSWFIKLGLETIFRWPSGKERKGFSTHRHHTPIVQISTPGVINQSQLVFQNNQAWEKLKAPPRCLLIDLSTTQR